MAPLAPWGDRLLRPGRPPELPLLPTTRLMLRPFAPAGAETVAVPAGDRAIATTLSISHPYRVAAEAQGLWAAG